MAIVNGYLTVEEAASYIGTAAGADPSFVDACVTAASRQIDNYCGRRFYAEGTDDDPADRLFDTTGTATIDIDDVASIASVKSDDGSGTWATTHTSYEAVSPQRGWPVNRLRLLDGTFPAATATTTTQLVKVTGVWGWEDIPAEVPAACRLLTAELVKLRDAPLGVTGGDFGAPMYVRRNLPGQVVSLLSIYRTASTFGIA